MGKPLQFYQNHEIHKKVLLDKTFSLYGMQARLNFNGVSFHYMDLY